MPIPAIPGDVVPDEHVQFLKRRVAELCGLERYRFPGSQPISFGKADLTKLEKEDYWVCEKSDGVRVLVFINRVENSTDVYLIDRHDHYRCVTGYYFPYYEDRRRPLGDTILDGELVIDSEPMAGQVPRIPAVRFNSETKMVETIRLLLFDCLVHNEQNIMSKPLSSRYGRLQQWLYDPYAKMLSEMPTLRENQAFDIQVKKMELSYHVEKVIKEDIPRLKHGNDGLIYTCAESPYVVGTDERILKWKPPSENSIDFRLELRFPPLASDPARADLTAKPIFILNVWLGKNRSGERDPNGKIRETYEYFDVMSVDDHEWAEIKASGEQYDSRVVEVCWDVQRASWRKMRFRDDKPEGNHRSVVDKIVQSILDGTEQDELVARSAAVKAAWKVRQAAPKRQPLPSQSDNHSHNHHYQHQAQHPQTIAAYGATQPNPGPPRPFAPLGKPILNKVQWPDTWLGWRR